MNKVLYILHYPPPIHGASMVGKYIKESALINSTLNGRYINLGLSKNVDEIGKGGISKFFTFIKILSLTFFNLVFFRPKLVYFTLTASGSGFYKDALVVLLVKLFQGNIVFHFHNKGVSKRQDISFDDFLYRKIFKNSKVILLSEHLYYDIEKYVSKSDVYYCPNGVPEIATINDRKIKNEKIEILFLSNLIASKGVHILLEACRILKNKKIAFNCTFIGGEGDITKEDFNKKVISLELSAFVSYLGKKYGKDKEDAYQKADIFVLPTFYENECFPLVLLEAMQYSLPIITTNEGGIPEIVTDGVNGFLIEKNNETMLAQKLETLLTSEETRLPMGEKGNEIFHERFKLDAFEKRLTRILSSLSS